MLRKTLKKQGEAWIVFLGLVAVSILGFEAGLISGKSGSQSAPLRIELAPTVTAPVSAAAPATQSAITGERTAAPVRPVSDTGNASCAFVASRNSKLYHAVSCAVVKRIKPENRLCFKEASEAAARGLTPGCTK